MWKGDKEKLKEQILEAFIATHYPIEYDFNRAKADYDYQEKAISGKKEWFNVNKEDLISYGEIIHFFDKRGAIYYLPAYMINIINYNDLAECSCLDSVIHFLEDIDIQLFSEEQRLVVLYFLQYCKFVIYKELHFDMKELDFAFSRFYKTPWYDGDEQ